MAAVQVLVKRENELTFFMSMWALIFLECLKNNQNKGECNRMAKQIELVTVFSGEAARIFNEYIESPDHSSTPESRALIEKARRLARKLP